MAYDNNNTGVLFKNSKKSEDNQPDYTGKVTINGEEFELAGWIKVGKQGSKIEGQNYLSLAIRPPRDSQGGSGDNQGRSQKQGRSGGGGGGGFSF